jgi:hypothetical protein
MNKLEMLDSFKQRFKEKLNPSLQSIKYCQSIDSAILELQFLNEPETKSIDLNFIGGEITKNEDGTDKDILPLFNPDVDFIDNANRMLEMDDESLINCLDGILTEDAIKQILAIHEPKTK